MPNKDSIMRDSGITAARTEDGVAASIENRHHSTNDATSRHYVHSSVGGLASRAAD